MNSVQLLKVVQQYSRNNEAGDGDIKVIRVPDQKTVFVEQIDGVGRASIRCFFISHTLGLRKG